MATRPTKTRSATTAAKKTPATEAEKPETQAADSGEDAPTPKAPPAPEPKVVTVSEPAVAAPEMKKKELIDTVVARSGIKKKDAKPVIEAMLAVLGESIGDGRELNLQPMGKLKINRSEDKANGRVIVCKLRQPNGPSPAPKDPLADAAE